MLKEILGSILLISLCCQPVISSPKKVSSKSHVGKVRPLKNTGKIETPDADSYFTAYNEIDVYGAGLTENGGLGYIHKNLFIGLLLTNTSFVNNQKMYQNGFASTPFLFISNKQSLNSFFNIDIGMMLGTMLINTHPRPFYRYAYANLLFNAKKYSLLLILILL